MLIEPSAPLSYHVDHHIGLITLRRPDSLNALNVPLITGLHQVLQAWGSDPAVQAVIVQGEGERAFSVGGDLRAVYEAHMKGDTSFYDQLFRQEYSLNFRIAQFPKPYISFMHGFTMGGGLGLSVHGSYRILTEDVKLAMPETKIGYFPDVGASYFLNKAPGALGMYLALTGHTIGTSDSLYAGLGTHFIAQKKHAQVMDDLLKADQLTPHHINEILQRYAEKLPPAPLEMQQEKIDALFTHSRLEDIFQALEADQSTFSQDTLRILNTRSPTSLCITFELLQRNRGKSLKEAIETEFQLSQVFIRKHDFFEGIRALIIDKDHTPHWRPATIQEVSADIILEYFENKTKPLFE